MLMQHWLVSLKLYQAIFLAKAAFYKDKHPWDWSWFTYSFINFIIPIPVTSIRPSWGNCQGLPRHLQKQIEELLDYVGKRIAKALTKEMMLLSFCLGNYIADDFNWNSNAE